LRSIVRVHWSFRRPIHRTIWRLDSFVVGIRRHLGGSLILGLLTTTDHLRLRRRDRLRGGRDSHRSFAARGNGLYLLYLRD
jgi:hypothetical protein